MRRGAHGIRGLIIVLLGLGVALASPASSALADSFDMSDMAYNVPVSQEEIAQIRTVLPEYGGVDPSLLNPAQGLNFEFFQAGALSLTFLYEGANYKNSLGYFLYDDNGDVISEHTIFANASGTGPGLEGGGSLDAGATVNLGSFDAGTRVGFWVQANGYRNPNGYKYYSLESLNPDGQGHFALWLDTQRNRVVYGVEDIYDLGDHDFNDMVFTVNFTPNTTNQGATPEPATGLLAASALGMAGWLRRRRAKNASAG